MRQVGHLIADALSGEDTEEMRAKVISAVKDLTDSLPLYPEMREWLKPIVED